MLITQKEKLTSTMELVLQWNTCRYVRLRRATFSENVCEQELEEGNYEISFMVKRGHRKVMSTVLRNY